MIVWTVIAVFTVLCVGATYVVRLRRSKREADAAVKKFYRRLGGVVTSRDVLSSYVPDYFNTMNDAGWGQFVVHVEALLDIQDWITNEYQQGRYSNARLAADLLTDSLTPERRGKAMARLPNIKRYVGWQKQTNAILLPIVACLIDAAHQTKDIGVSREHRREATLLICRNLMNIIRGAIVPSSSEDDDAAAAAADDDDHGREVRPR